MSIDHWEKRANGDIATNPVLGFETASFQGHGIVRLEYADSPQDVARMKGLHLQIGMTAVQARDLGEGLIRLAEAIEARG